MIAKKALIVDDSRLAQFVLKKMLVEEKIDVDTTASAEEALNYLNRQTPDMIFLDHTMPGMNGLEALQIIKDNPATESIPVMMYTSQEDRAYMTQARKMGAADVLPKQLKPEELQEALYRLDGKPGTEQLNPTPASDSETLEQLVYDAEEALKYETWQQKMQQQFENQQQASEQEFNRLNGRVDTLLDQQERAKNNAQSFWNNLLWFAIYSATIVFFGVIFFQQKESITELSQIIAANKSTATTTRSTSISSAPIPSTPAPSISAPVPSSTQTAATAAGSYATSAELMAANTASATAQAVTAPGINSRRLRALERILNADNQVPFGEPLLGAQVQELLTEILVPLNQANFRGVVDIIGHDGDFCLASGSDGALTLAPDDSPVSSCQITSPNTQLADIASDELTQFVAAESSDAIRFELTAMGSTKPLEAYPDTSENVTAGLWNNIALSNRRIEIRFTESP